MGGQKMEATVDIARRGQITIPKNIREAMGIEEGQKYALRALEGGVLILTPRRGRATAALQQLRNELLSKGATLEEMLAELRRMRETNE
jgi:AbrB family looped-hinge helix DNA binding protein